MLNNDIIHKIEIPFIHLLRSPNGKYFYDVNTNDLVSVSDKTYSALTDLLNNHSERLDQSDLEEIEKIKTVGFL